MRLIDGAALRAAVTPERAIAALEDAFRHLVDYSWPQRSVLEVDEADMLLMPAAGPVGAGTKIVTINPANPARGHPLIHALYVLFAPGTLSPAAVIDGDVLTGLRTASVSALATRYLAREDARHLVVFGAGAQARAHIEVLPVVRPIEKVTIVSRTRGPAEALAAAARRADLEVTVGGAEAVATADIVCTCTTSDEPLFRGADLAPGAHVNAVGAYRPMARETDDDLVSRAGVVAVETAAAATAEAGDVVIPIERGIIQTTDLVEMAEIVAGRRIRASDDDVTFFKSVGLAPEDLAVAALCMEEDREG